MKGKKVLVNELRVDLVVKRRLYPNNLRQSPLFLYSRVRAQ